jgi:3-methyl-2-oxobutanoate hydroxymethyltransferase
LNLAILQQMKQRGEKIAVLTCYDAIFAKLMAAERVDVLLVGDSLGMVLQGAGNTLGVTLQDMVYHTRTVAAGAGSAIIVADLPYGTYEHAQDAALQNSEQLIAAGAHIVKIEGGSAIVETAAHLIEHGIPVCAHLGFTPQSVEKLGGYKIQGRTEDSARQITSDAIAMSKAGVSLIVLEMVPAALAKTITKSIEAPTIGIGAGADCSGQVLVLQDLIGIYTGEPDKNPAEFKAPRFVRNFLQETGSIQDAVRLYVKSVKDKSFPAAEHSY